MSVVLDLSLFWQFEADGCTEAAVNCQHHMILASTSHLEQLQPHKSCFFLCTSWQEIFFVSSQSRKSGVFAACINRIFQRLKQHKKHKLTLFSPLLEQDTQGCY